MGEKPEADVYQQWRRASREGERDVMGVSRRGINKTGVSRKERK